MEGLGCIAGKLVALDELRYDDDLKVDRESLLHLIVSVERVRPLGLGKLKLTKIVHAYRAPVPTLHSSLLTRARENRSMGNGLTTVS